MEDTTIRDTGHAAVRSGGELTALGSAAEANSLLLGLSEMSLKRQPQAEQHIPKLDIHAGGDDGEQDLRSKADQTARGPTDETSMLFPNDRMSSDQHCDAMDGNGKGQATDAPTKPQICFDFTKGMCMRGDKCKFSHDLATIVQFNSKEKGICFDYLRSSCQRGLLCRFSHDLSTIAQQCQVFNGIATKGRTNAICYDFVKGVCQRGSECRYSHDLSLIARTARGGANSTRTGEVCYDYLRGRCNRGANCKYSHNISFLGPAGFFSQPMSCESGSSTGSQGSAGSSAGGAMPPGSSMLLQQVPGYHNGSGGMQQTSMPEGDMSQMGHGSDLEQPAGNCNEPSTPAQMWSHPSTAEFGGHPQVGSGMPPAPGSFGHHAPPHRGHFPGHHAPPPFMPVHGPSMSYMHQLQQAAAAASMHQQHQQQQQGALRNVRRNSADCANSSLAAATAQQALSMYQRLHGLPPAAVNSLMAQVCSADASGWTTDSNRHQGQGPNRMHGDGSGMEPSSLGESYSVPSTASYSLADAGLDAANLACLPPSLLPLLKEIWNK